MSRIVSITDTIAIHTRVFIDTVIGPMTEVINKIIEVRVISLHNEYTVYRNQLSEHGTFLSEEGYVRLFKVITEILIVDHNNLITNDNADSLDHIIGELEYSIHKKFKFNTSISMDDVDVGMSVLMDTIDSKVRKFGEQYIVDIIPLRWITTDRLISLEVGVINKK